MLKALETLSRLARLLFWPALIFALVMAVLPQPPQLPMTDMGDKVQHMLAFFTLTLLAGTGWPRLALVWVLLALSLVGAGIELVQAIPVLHRTADWRDWVADTAAICAGLVPVAVFRSLLEQRSAA